MTHTVTHNHIPHLSLPLRLSGNRYATVEQDTDGEAADCVKVITSFPLGFRAEDLDFGISDPSFQTQPIDVDQIAQAIADYEPRVDASIDTVDLADGTTTVDVRVTLPTSDELPEEAS